MHQLNLETAHSKDFYDKLELDVYLVILADLDEFMIEQLHILQNNCAMMRVLWWVHENIFDVYMDYL